MSPERIPRHDDERLYQPKIHSRHIRSLHRLSLETGEPITALVDRALTEFVARHTGTEYTSPPPSRPPDE